MPPVSRKKQQKGRGEKGGCALGLILDSLNTLARQQARGVASAKGGKGAGGAAAKGKADPGQEGEVWMLRKKKKQRKKRRKEAEG